MGDRLDVWLGNRRAGVLTRGRRSGLTFSADLGAPGFSVAIRDPADWTPARATAWFEGLLPEGETRARIAARFGIPESDSFGLLEAIGWECAGAISVVPEGHAVPTGSYRALTDDEVGQRLDALPGRPFDDEAALRASLGGVQSKLVLARRDDAWTEPLDGAPSTHILKPEPDTWPGIAAAEAWALTVASAVTSAAEADVRTDLGSRPVVVVRRFDRVDGDPIQRVHQEDLCQMLGLPPSAKYSEPPPKPSKPSWLHLATTLLARSVDPPSALDRLLRQLSVNLALGNADAHAKNLSVLHIGGGLISLSPMYDVVPTLAFIPRQRLASLPVGGRYRLADIGAEQVVAEARGWGMPERVAWSTIEATVDAIRAGIPAADEKVPSIPERVRTVVLAQVQQFAATVATRRR
ncbi:MAG: type II toxin-antitoxin system HipA family toxin [Candidatus Limnocylindrales bacterium]